MCNEDFVSTYRGGEARVFIAQASGVNHLHFEYLHDLADFWHLELLCRVLLSSTDTRRLFQMRARAQYVAIQQAK